MKHRLDSTVAVIRAYANKFVGKQVKNLLNAGLGMVVVVTDAVKDKGATRGWLDELQLGTHKLKLIEMHEGYSWANALNVALKAIQISNVVCRATGRPEFRFVLNVSVEAQFSQAHIETMVESASADPSVGVVGTTFEGRQDSNLVEIGRSYRHPRNTGMLIRLSAFGVMMGAFDARCDALGGMEDIFFLLEMLAVSELTFVMLDLRVRLVLGVHHHQPTKEQREQQAMDAIVAHWRNIFPRDSAEYARINEAILRMGLED